MSKLVWNASCLAELRGWRHPYLGRRQRSCLKGLLMKRLLGLGVLALAGSIGSAQAAVITFEDIAVGVGVDSFHAGASDPVSGGFLFDASNHSHIANAAWATDNGGTYLVVDDVLGPDVLTISPQAGGAFALTSIDISEAHFSTSIFARQVQVVGNLFGGGTVSTTLFLDSNLVENVLANYFQTFNFGAAWGNLASFTLTGAGALVGGNYYAIDNVNVGAAVPEPATLSLLGLGAACLFGRRRRTAR